MSIIDLDQHRRRRQLLELVAESVVSVEPPPIEDLGWRPVRFDEEGRTIRWFDARYRAFIGYVPGTPELVYLDYRSRCTSYRGSIEQLAIGLQSGRLELEVIAIVES